MRSASRSGVSGGFGFHALPDGQLYDEGGALIGPTFDSNRAPVKFRNSFADIEAQAESLNSSSLRAPGRRDFDVSEMSPVCR